MVFSTPNFQHTCHRYAYYLSFFFYPDTGKTFDCKMVHELWSVVSVLVTDSFIFSVCLYHCMCLYASHHGLIHDHKYHVEVVWSITAMSMTLWSCTLILSPPGFQQPSQLAKSDQLNFKVQLKLAVYLIFRCSEGTLEISMIIILVNWEGWSCDGVCLWQVSFSSIQVKIAVTLSASVWLGPGRDGNDTGCMLASCSW